MRILHIIALILVIVGAVNWGLVGLFDFNLVAAIFGPDSAVSNIVYVLVGIAGIYCIYLIKPVLDGSRHHAVTRV